MSAITAHIVESVPAQAIAAGTVALVCGAVGFVGWLIVQHHVVKYGRLRVDRVAQAGAVVMALVLGAAVLPASAASQDRETPVGLPDLISDPPFIWANKLVPLDDGDAILALAFDGYLHNVGEGVLELYGNPQVPGGVQQRWWDGEAWIEVASPRVLYETTDDHNHFHLMAAAEYELWNEAQTQRVGDASKVGFCLLDSMQRENGYDAFYDINTYNYCEVENPEAELLRMGITPGWVDLYDANTTLQWVDVSDTQPGWYWVGAIMDPEDQIVESNEDNNGLIFSTNKFAVPGAIARPLPVQTAGTPIQLKADLIGEVGDIVWTVTSPPSQGQLSVPTGVDLFDDVVTYLAEPGFDGVDSFEVSARDISSAFPLTPARVTIEVDASDADDSAVAAFAASELDAPVTASALELLEWTYFETSAADLADVTLPDGELRFFARDLAPGLRIDQDTGRVHGTPTLASPGVGWVYAFSETRSVAIEVPWAVARPDQEARNLDDMNDFSTPFGANSPRQIGKRVADAMYTAAGLPPGTEVSSNVPRIGGAPTEIGDFEVEITATVDGEVVDATSFTWTVRPSTMPTFPL